MTPALDEDKDDDLLSIVRVLVPAIGAPLPQTTAPRSIFDIDALAMITTRIERARSAASAVSMIVHNPGITRCVGASYPSRWTPEDEERERLRRENQRPPKPTRKAKTKGRRQLSPQGAD